MRNAVRISLAMFTAAVTVLVLVVAPAAAAGNTQLSATGRFDTSGQCTELASAITPIVMTGDIVGCWYTPTYEVQTLTPSGTYRETGTETFVGCLSDGTTCGTFSTTYQFEAKFAPDGSEIRGRCQHPFVGGTGDFAGITGRIDMKDNVATGEFYVRGHFNLP